MKKLILGILLVVLGLPGTAYFFSDFIRLILGGLPLILILGGGLAVYLGYEDIQAEKELAADTDPEPPAEEAAHDLDSPTSAPEPQIDEPEPAPSPASAEEGMDTGYNGNTDTQVFHSLSCNFAQGKKCTARFKTRDEAIAEGYKPCKVCNP